MIPNFLLENSGDQTQNGSRLGGGDVNRKPGKEMNPENQEAWIRNRDQAKKRWIGNRDVHRKPENLCEEPRSNRKHGLGTENKNLKTGIGNKEITKEQDWEQKTKDWKQGPLLSLKGTMHVDVRKCFSSEFVLSGKPKILFVPDQLAVGSSQFYPNPPKWP